VRPLLVFLAPENRQAAAGEAPRGLYAAPGRAPILPQPRPGRHTAWMSAERLFSKNATSAGFEKARR
jgi:hypothetical protein